MIYKKSILSFKESKKVIPGGVNSPVRAFKSVNCNPIFFKKGKGSKVYDEDGNEKETTQPKHQGVDYAKLTPILTKGLQEAVARIEVLETKVAALEGG